MAQDSNKGAAHAFLIFETGLAGNDLDRVTALLDHQPRGVEPKTLDRLRGRHSGFRSEGSAERAD